MTRPAHHSHQMHCIKLAHMKFNEEKLIQKERKINTRLLKTGELGVWTDFGALVGGTLAVIFVCSSSFSISPSSTSF